MALIYFLFLFSGASALIYEVAWLRLLGLSFGSTTEAASCVISVFLGGLALGAFFGGRLADRLKDKHLAVYGLMEIGIGILAPLIGWPFKYHW
jgi:spermidine synthase